MTAAACAAPPLLDDRSTDETEEARRVGSQVRRDRLHVTAMAPLVIGRLDAPEDPSFEHEWAHFAQDLAQAKALGVDAISIDVWWGSVERAGDQQFDFRWVDRVAHAIVSAGLQFRPVLAFHSCGTNVGDVCHVPLPQWVFQRYAGKVVPGTGVTVRSRADLLYVSAQGNVSDEALSVWATPLVVEQYRELVAAFVQRYAHLAPHTSGIAVGLGSASELRYPSYNAHDVGAGYPGPGVLQAYSSLAQAHFRHQMLSRYGDLGGVAAAWGRQLQRLDDVRLPARHELDGFFGRGEHLHTRYGRDLFEWYRGSLLEHGEQVLGAASEVIQASAFRDVRITARIPGVHWRVGDGRRAELSAGLLSTSDAETWNDSRKGHGYSAVVGLMARLRARPERPHIALDFTCLELGNGEGGPAVSSMAEALVFWVADEAKRQGVPIGGENALAGGLWTEHGWSRIRNALTWSHYDELTLLRLSDVVRSPIARREVRALTHTAGAGHGR